MLTINQLEPIGELNPVRVGSASIFFTRFPRSSYIRSQGYLPKVVILGVGAKRLELFGLEEAKGPSFVDLGSGLGRRRRWPWFSISRPAPTPAITPSSWASTSTRTKTSSNTASPKISGLFRFYFFLFFIFVWFIDWLIDLCSCFFFFSNSEKFSFEFLALLILAW